MNSRKEKCLIVKLAAIGDVAMAVSAVRQLSDAGASIDWLCGKSVLPLLDCYTWINPVPVDDARLFTQGWTSAIAELVRVWRLLVGRRYDTCALLHYDARYRALMLPVRSRRVIRLSKHNRKFALVGDRHHTDEYARILCDRPDTYQAEGVRPVRPDRLPTSPMPKQTGRLRIALVPGGARNLLRDDAVRRWPLASYVDLAHKLEQRGCEVVLTGGPDDVWVTSEFASASVVNCIGQWPLPETLAFYDTCDVVVTHDTGPLHLAGLMGCGIVGLFGPTTPSSRMPRRPRSVGIWGGDGLPCAPCYDSREFAPCVNNGCMQAISVERVLRAIAELTSP